MREDCIWGLKMENVRSLPWGVVCDFIMFVDQSSEERLSSEYNWDLIESWLMTVTWPQFVVSIWRSPSKELQSRPQHDAYLNILLKTCIWQNPTTPWKGCFCSLSDMVEDEWEGNLAQYLVHSKLSIDVGVICGWPKHVTTEFLKNLAGFLKPATKRFYTFITYLYHPDISWIQWGTFPTYSL